MAVNVEDVKAFHLRVIQGQRIPPIPGAQGQPETNNDPFLVHRSGYYPQPVVYVLGGGPSLRDFNFELLRDKFVIGCNDAYKLGGELVNVVFFGDEGWWGVHRNRILVNYDGLIVTNQRRRGGNSFHGVKWMKKLSVGYSSQDGVLGWNSNSGCAALNLALLFGAKTVILLGFDMKLSQKDGASNWHPNECAPPRESSYTRFQEAFKKIHATLSEGFPGVEVINANLDSALNLFPKMDREEALKCY